MRTEHLNKPNNNNNNNNVSESGTEDYVQICALFALYIQLNRKLCIHIYIVLERVNY